MAGEKYDYTIPKNQIIDINYDQRTLNEFFKMLHDGYKKLTEERKKNEKLIAEENKKRAKEEAKLRLAEQNKNFKAVREQERKLAQERYKENKEYLKEYEKLTRSGKELTPEQKEDLKTRKEEIQLAKSGKLSKVASVSKSLLNTVVSALGKLSSGIDSAMKTYVGYQTGINARLQGSIPGVNNYFRMLETNIQSRVGITSLFKTETMMNNLQKLVQAGVATDLEQRAFLNTLKDDIATTFNAANGTLLRLIRLQSQDSTAMRLGMEAYLTKFLNETVKNTEYLSKTFDDVESALVEAQAVLNSAGASAEMEYVVQKWLGVLTGRGLSEQAASNIATALGQLGSADINALSGSDMNYLLQMAVSRAGKSYTDIMQQGLTAGTANDVMRAMVEYMSEVGGMSNVQRSALANVMGVSVSDLISASNISASELSKVTSDMLSYSAMFSELETQMGTLYERIPETARLSTYFENLQFKMGSQMASDPVMAATWYLANMVEHATGGINIPVVGGTVTGAIKAGIIGADAFNLVGPILAGIGNMQDPTAILSQLGISAPVAESRGTGLRSRARGYSTSETSYIGSSDSDVLYQETMARVHKEATQIQAMVDEEDPSKAINSYLSETLEGHMIGIEEKLATVIERMDEGTFRVRDDALNSSVSRLAETVNDIGF